MVNSLPIMLTPATMSLFTSLASDSIGSWEELKKVFTDNYMATCTRPGTKHDLNCINQKPSELLHSYIRRFSEMRNSIPNIMEAKVSPLSSKDFITASFTPSSTASRPQGLAI